MQPRFDNHLDYYPQKQAEVIQHIYLTMFESKSSSNVF